MKTLVSILAILYATTAFSVPLPPRRPVDLGSPTAKPAKPYTGVWLPPKEIQQKVAPKN